MMRSPSQLMCTLTCSVMLTGNRANSIFYRKHKYRKKLLWQEKTVVQRFFRVQLFFTCTVQLCFREDGGCDGISPPRCLNIGDNLPSTAPSSRSISRELNFRPSRPSLRKPPLSRENHHFGSDFK